MKPTCKNCAWRSYNEAKTEFSKPVYRCLNADSTRYRDFVKNGGRCTYFEPEYPERIAS